MNHVPPLMQTSYLDAPEGESKQRGTATVTATHELSDPSPQLSLQAQNGQHSAYAKLS